MDAILNYKPSEADDYYQILGCDELSSTEQIIAEYKMRVLHCHPDKHPGDPAAAERFERLQTAKSVLAEPEERAKYDLWRRAQICIPYGQWRGLRDTVHTSMHWATKARTDPMLEGPDNTDSREASETNWPSSSNQHHDSTCPHHATPGSQRHAPWQRGTPSESLRRFRNYQI